MSMLQLSVSLAFSGMWMSFHDASAAEASLTFSVLWMLLRNASAEGAAVTVFHFSGTWMPLHNASTVGAALSPFMSCGCYSNFFCHVDATPRRQCSRCSIEYLSLFLQCGC